MIMVAVVLAVSSPTGPSRADVHESSDAHKDPIDVQPRKCCNDDDVDVDDDGDNDDDDDDRSDKDRPIACSVGCC